jgi:hypothetical protein
MLEEGEVVMYRVKAYQDLVEIHQDVEKADCICLCLPLSCITKLNWMLKQKCYIIIWIQLAQIDSRAEQSRTGDRKSATAIYLIY